MGPQSTVSRKQIQMAISSRHTNSQLQALIFSLVPLLVCSIPSLFMLEIPMALISLKESPPKLRPSVFCSLCLAIHLLKFLFSLEWLAIYCAAITEGNVNWPEVLVNQTIGMKESFHFDFNCFHASFFYFLLVVWFVGFLSAGVCLSGYGGQPSRECLFNAASSNEGEFGVIVNPCFQRTWFPLADVANSPWTCAFFVESILH